MKITTIQISGFRKILKATINMEDDITVIAGANNSGKTSIVELFNYVFNAKGALCSDDFPVYESQEWCTAVFPYFQADVRQSSSTNATINTFAAEALSDAAPTVETLYSWKDSSGCIVSNNICLEFQGQTDGYARTLEEAMLAKRYNVLYFGNHFSFLYFLSGFLIYLVNDT